MTPETISALVNMGSAGAVIAVVIIFTRNIREMNKENAAAQAVRDKEWRDFFTALAGGNEARIHEMKQTAGEMGGKLDVILTKIDVFLSRFDTHDTQSKAMRDAVAELRLELARLAPKPTSRSRGQ